MASKEANERIHAAFERMRQTFAETTAVTAKITAMFQALIEKHNEERNKVFDEFISHFQGVKGEK
jgi:capsid protein